LTKVQKEKPRPIIVASPDPAKDGVATPLKLWTFGVACGFALFGRDPTTRGKKEGWLSGQGVDEICAFLLPTTAGRYK
jgi:hypothetical protein